MRGLLAAISLSVALAATTAHPGHADDRLALRFLAFVYAIEASSAWSARMHGLEIDEGRDTVTIDSLVITAQSGGFGLQVEDARLVGYDDDRDGGFAAEAVDVARATIAMPGTEIVLTNLRLTDVETPALAAISFNRTKPFTSLMAVLGAIAKSAFSDGRIARITVEETFGTKNSLIAYNNVDFGALRAGKLESASAAPLVLKSPVSDPLAELTVAQARAETIDLAAFAAIGDPLRYVAGIGAGQWLPAIDSVEYSDVILAMPGIDLILGKIVAEDVKVRQPRESFAPLIDGLMSQFRTPQYRMESLRSRHLGGLLSAFGVGRFAIHDIEVAAGGIDQLALAGFELTDASSDQIGKIAIDGFAGAIAGQGGLGVGHFALGDVVLPAFETVGVALAQAQRGDDVDLSSLLPRLGLVEAADITLRAVDFPGVALGALQARFDAHIGKVPTAIAVQLDDLDIAAASLPNQRLQTLIAGLGYDRIIVDTGFDLTWREADATVSLDDFRLDIANFGNTTGNLVLAGLTRHAIEETSDGTALLDDLRFERARMTFEDKSVVDRSLSMRAELLNVPLDRLKQQLAGALPLMLAVLGDADRVKQIVPTLQDFIKTPDSLTIEAAPESPVPIAEIGNAIRTRPQSLPGLLSISITGPSGSKTEGVEAGSAGAETSQRSTTDGKAKQRDTTDTPTRPNPLPKNKDAAPIPR